MKRIVHELEHLRFLRAHLHNFAGQTARELRKHFRASTLDCTKRGKRSLTKIVQCITLAQKLGAHGQRQISPDSQARDLFQARRQHFTRKARADSTAKHNLMKVCSASQFRSDRFRSEEHTSELQS